MIGLPRLAVLCDYPEELWPSMDLAAEMFHREVVARHSGDWAAERVCPPFGRRFQRLPWWGRRRAAFNADRLVNRLWSYPRHLRRRSAEFDGFHLCDHSYAQLLHVVPRGRAGVFCHDLDTFRCVLEPSREHRPRWFRAMVRHILDGFRKAAVVFHPTRAVGEQLLRHGLADPDRLILAPNGVSPEFTPGPDGPAAALDDGPFLLHVGSCIPRKRIDVLLEVFAAARGRLPGLRLIQIGGDWTPEQRDQLHRLGIEAAVTQKRGLSREELTAHYRQAALVLQPSEAEGFGLPVIEALSCGAVVLASDIPVLREVGGDAVLYRPVADTEAWAETARQILADPSAAPARAVRLAQAQRYSWAAQAEIIMRAYQRLLS